MAGDVSLLRGWLPTTIALAALASVAAVLARRDWRGVLRWLVPSLAGSFALVVLVNSRLDVQSRFGEPIPFSFLLWATLPLTALVAVVAGWRGQPAWRRVTSIAAVPLCFALASNSINRHYGYIPTVGALVGADVEHQIASSELQLSTPTSIAAAAAPPAPVRTHGVVTTLDIPGTISGFHARQAYIWLPPAFFDTPRPQLPVIVMMSGVPGQPENMIRAAGADHVADRFAHDHNGRAPIIVFPDENGSLTSDTECVDGGRGHAETYLTRDLPAFVTTTFATATGPRRWGVAGYSEGGTCAMELALAHPDVYGTFVDISGDAYPNLGTGSDLRASTIRLLYDGDALAFDQHDPALLAARPQDHAVAGWFEAGRGSKRDVNVASALAAMMRADGLQCRTLTTSGAHDFSMAHRAVADSFAWLAERVGAAA